MAKTPPPSEEESTSRSSTRRRHTDELTARANRAAERPLGAGKPTREVATEILDRALLPDDDEGTRVEDPVEEDRRKKESELLQGKKAREEARRRAEKASSKAAARPEDVRKAEHLLESFLAAHQRTKDTPKKAPPVPPAPPPPKPRAVPPPQVAEAAPRVASTLPAPPPPSLPPVLPPPPGQGGVLFALNQAQPPGVFFVELQPGQGEETEDPALAAAVDEAIGVLFGVRGIHHIGPGHNEAGEPVVVIAASQDFGEAALRAIPESVGNFRTLLTLPYDLLPLRRNR